MREAEEEEEAEADAEAYERVAPERVEQRSVRLVLEREAARVQTREVVVFERGQRLPQLLAARLALERAACTRTRTRTSHHVPYPYAYMYTRRVLVVLVRSRLSPL